MRLTEIKLAGFKSFVDPATIATPGQLVGIVGPNGCGKSNVIDAVRWVLGESKASALRGESMQDVIFNGAGDRAPVGRASVELFFDNSQGRIGGQWGRYTELSLKRILTRDGDSTYYINNIPVRRRDIHDLFLGTGLGPRAYAIIEQGMISRVIEAKPEELRVFLEEAAGVSKYKERRKETESRLADTRANLARVEDIRTELAAQLEKLEAQAQVAAQYRDFEARLKQAQHLLWFAKQQDAARLREKHTNDIASFTSAFEAVQAELRAAENRVETLRAEQYRAADALHEKQGAFYAANAEVTRLVQQLQFARESEERLAQQAAQINELLAGLAGQIEALQGEIAEGESDLARAAERSASASADERTAASAVPDAEGMLAKASEALAEIQQRVTALEQAIRVAETKRESVDKALTALEQRRERLDAETASLGTPFNDRITQVAEQLEQESADLAAREAALGTLREAVQALQERQRSASDGWEQASRALAEHEARSTALAALQARIGRGKDVDEWLATRKLEHARRLWQQLDIERGWEDALEAVLRERLNALEIDKLDGALAWLEDGTLPIRIAAYAADAGAATRTVEPDALLAKVRPARPALSRVLADWLAGVRCRGSVNQALAERSALRSGEAFVTPEGHVVAAQSISFFAPDSELHGVLARQRELSELEGSIAAARRVTEDAAGQRDTVEA
ncbi:MAG TPA: chromosome segregation protein SMC, partial [Casimicrobiaceae bacterium]|nr:chromosome segregation protein SMC [Casimicrobiaceae bacterium]